jgi:hypothetical protein
MPLEEQIVEWSRTRPAWQRVVLKRVAEGEVLTDQDYDQLVENMLASTASALARIDPGLPGRSGPRDSSAARARVG